MRFQIRRMLFAVGFLTVASIGSHGLISAPCSFNCYKFTGHMETCAPVAPPPPCQGACNPANNTCAPYSIAPILPTPAPWDEVLPLWKEGQSGYQPEGCYEIVCDNTQNCDCKTVGNSSSCISDPATAVPYPRTVIILNTDLPPCSFEGH